jgi:peptidoglycan/xylan/chitin deacetylase (PgdA/CDA1 family)
VAALGHPEALRNCLLYVARARGHGLVLAYHSVGPRTRRRVVVEPIPPERFAEQMRALEVVGDVVPLHDLLSACTERCSRPVFAVTFDDDDPGYVRYVLPILRELTIPATFFLSGRSLHGLGPYWWTLVDRSIEEVGFEATAAMLGRRARSIDELAAWCRSVAAVPELSTRVTPEVMQPGDIRALARAGMTIGFHTLRHRVLPLLDDAELDVELREGRAELASLVGQPVDLMAYPYGAVEARVAEAAERAGYTAAFTTEWRAVSCRSHRFLVSRWQPGPLNARDFLAQAALRLNLCGQQAGSRQQAAGSRQRRPGA